MVLVRCVCVCVCWLCLPSSRSLRLSMSKYYYKLKDKTRQAWVITLVNDRPESQGLEVVLSYLHTCLPCLFCRGSAERVCIIIKGQERICLLSLVIVLSGTHLSTLSRNILMFFRSRLRDEREYVCSIYYLVNTRTCNTYSLRASAAEYKW